MSDNNPSHWCKSVIEEVTRVNPLQPPTTSPTASTPYGYYPTTSNQSAAYQNYMYQQQQQQYYNAYNSYYSTSQPMAYSAPTSTVAPPAYAATNTPTYASVVVQGKAATSAGAPAEVTAAQRPNPVRFAATGTSSNSTTSSATAAKADKKQSPMWPPSLKAYVERAFTKCTSDEDRSYVSNALRILIAKVSSDNRLHVHKWELEPIPTPPPKPASAPTMISTTPAPTLASANKGIKQLTIDKAPEAEVSSPRRKKSRWGQEPVLSTTDAKMAAKANIAPVDLSAEELRQREQRANRFAPAVKPEPTMHHKLKKKHKVVKKPQISNSTTLTDIDLENLIIVGTCQRLEKDYLRLTAPPDPSTVRPEPVLRAALEMVKSKYSNEEVEYDYVCSQMKSIRQDLTVQHIQNEFTVLVYETHARIALESDDLNEYNQCQTQLMHLYASGIKGCELEFTAYRILYYIYLDGNKKYNKGHSDMLNVITNLPRDAEKDIAVKHALLVRQATIDDNYYRFFLLYRDTPNLGNFILDQTLDNWRIKALQRMVKAYRPSLDLNFVIQSLEFDSPEEGREFLGKVGVVYMKSETGEELPFVDTKNTVIDTSGALAQDALL